MALNFNAEPYFDDYDENDKFYRILFRPGYAVQARELTQLQTILQNQITRQGNHLFKEGSMVIPGQISIDTDVAYVKLQSTYGTTVVSSFLSSLEGVTVVGQTTGVRALVTKTVTATSTDYDTIFVKYLNSGTDNDTKTFDDNEVIAPESGALAGYTVQSIASASTGNGSIASIQQGIYYVRGTFALVSTSSLILDKYSNTPSYRIGLTIAETFVTSDDDNALLDNAAGSYNYAAPGAHRYKINLTLSKLAVNSTSDSDFIELARVVNGYIQYKVTTTDYSVIEETLARRTYDESGDYTVKAFKIDLREHRNNDRGTWTASRAYLAGDIVIYSGKYYVARTSGTSGSTAPTHTIGEATDGAGGVTWLYDQNPTFNRGVYDALDANIPGDATKLAIGLEPGKAYVRGYEIEKIATEFIPINKGRDFDYASNVKVPATVGNYVLVTNIHNAPRIDQFATLSLYNRLTSSAGASAGTLVGTARARFIELHSGTRGNATAIYKLSIFDVQMVSGYDFNKDVKQFYYNGGSTATSFTADISPIQTQLNGSATASSSTTITGTGTLFESELVVGDFIYIGSSTITRRVTAVNSQTEIEVDTNVTATGEVVYKLTTQVLEPDYNPLVFNLPYFGTRSLRDDNGDNLTSYTAFERITGTAGSDNGDGTCTLTLTVSDGTFASAADAENYLVVDAVSGAVSTISSVTVSAGQTQVDIDVPDTYANNSMYGICAINKSGTGTEKTKSLTTVTAQTYTTTATATVKTISLGKADGFRLLSVLMDTGTFGSPTGTYSIDITDRYDFDDGQRFTHYDVAKIVLKDGRSAPTAPISVAFQYFTHSGTGDYFSVNSYTSTIAYDQIPYFANVRLADVIDFRPRIDDTGANFTGTGAKISLIPQRGVDINSFFSYYLSRKEKVALDLGGNFFNISGVSAVSPKEPNDPTNGMVLYKLDISPYTLAANSDFIGVQSIDNKRYTMRDIGKLEKRIDNLEYYTSLSLLEQETKSLTIPDDNGIDRFKNGFFVDNFGSQIGGNPSSLDWNCSVDLANNELRPFYSMDNVNLVEVNSLDADRTTDGYQITGDLITLPYTHEAMIDQPYASRLENINPFAIFTFLGRTDLNPASDEWIEVDRRPDIVNNVEGNYEAMKIIAERSGVLGTVWNAWEDVWTGRTVETDERLFLGGNEAAFRGWGGRGVQGSFTFTFAKATEVGQARTGVKTSIAVKVDRELVNDRLISSAVIPYIRSRNILFTTRGLKPSTTFYPFFDGTDISDYITPATRVEFTEVSSFGSTFDTETNAGAEASETARQVSGNPDVSLNKGDVVYVGTRGATNYNKNTSPCTGVVVQTEDVDGTLAIYVVNITGTFQEDDIIIGTLSEARGTVVSNVTNAVAGDDLVSNEFGDMTGLFNIPNTEMVRFRTGVREFKLIDNTANNQATSTSSSRAQYYAQGTLETRQATYNAVRNAQFVSEVVTENQTINRLSAGDRILEGTGWYDPLAQSFLIQETGGCFLTKIDLFFATKGDSSPVQLQIRDMVNGFPGKTILPFSIVYKYPDEVNISENTVTLADGEDYPAPDTATTFTFPSPVYVEEGKEYCICLISDSNNYKVWISQLGEQNAGTSRFISEQPYAGVLFKSQNASTWTADQSQDLKFKIYKANFDTDSVGSVEFINDKLSTVTLFENPFQTKTGSGKIRVSHKNHGMKAGDSVTISGAATSNGITNTFINTTHTIDSVEVDSYIITTLGTATSSGLAGGSSVVATENYQYQTIQPIVAYQDFSDTTFNLEMKQTTAQSVNGTETAYDQSAYFGIVPNANNVLFTNALVASEINETNNMSGDKSLYVRATLASSNANLSPVIDTDRLSCVLVNNKINNPSINNIGDSTLDTRTVIASNTTIAATGTTNVISSVNATAQAALKTVSVGKYITTSGFSTAANNGTFLVTAVDSSTGAITVSGSLTTEAATASVTITINERYISEISPMGSSTYSKYVSRQILLANPSTYVKIRVAVDLPTGAGIGMYYRTTPVGSSSQFNSIKYTVLSPDTTIIQNNDGQFYDVEYSVSDLEPFDSIGVKIVFTSTDSASVARVKDLRVIACA